MLKKLGCKLKFHSQPGFNCIVLHYMHGKETTNCINTEIYDSLTLLSCLNRFHLHIHVDSH